MRKLNLHKRLSHLNQFPIISFGLLLIGIGIIFINFPRKIDDNHRIKGAIVTHHLVAEELMIDLGKRLLGEGKVIPNIIIVGPNHDEVGDGHLLTDDETLIDENDIFLKKETVMVNRDHACFAPKSILQKYLPTTRITCVLVSSRVENREIEKMVEILKSKLKDNGVLVASVDFSHYLPLRDAQQNDSVTWKYMEKFDVESLLKLKNAYLDSPQSLAILFEYLKSIGSTSFSQIKHVNSAQILGVLDSPSTTSYFEVVYW